jgi:hypothetical protein
MRILIDINHPAHFHYFRNFIKLMEAKGHRFCVINRDSKMINQLLDYYGIEHYIRNKRPDKKGTIVSLTNLLKMILWCIRKSFNFHPDLYVGFGSSACAISSRLFNKPCILMDDTEHNAMNHKLYLPCCTAVLTPFYFKKELGNRNKQITFNAYVEQLYLHSAYYKKSNLVIEELNLKPKEYVIVRYIAYDAHHDMKAHPLSTETKKSILKEISKRYRVLVSLEKGVDDPFYEDYVLNISPEKMHDLEANAKFMVTEGATMASESFVHGVPFLYINPLKCGNIDYECEHYPNRCFQTTDENSVFDIIDRLMKNDIDADEEKSDVEKKTINPTEFLEQYIENYPTV